MSYKDVLLKNQQKSGPKLQSKSALKLQSKPQSQIQSILRPKTRSREQNENVDPQKSKHPPKGAIIKCDGFCYVYIDSYHEHAKESGIDVGDRIEAGGMWVVEYDKTSPDYMYAKAVFEYEKKYYYIPSMFSEIGTINPSSRWDLVEQKINYQIVYLDTKICRKICPGYLD